MSRIAGLIVKGGNRSLCYEIEVDKKGRGGLSLARSRDTENAPPRGTNENTFCGNRVTLSRNRTSPKTVLSHIGLQSAPFFLPSRIPHRRSS